MRASLWLSLCLVAWSGTAFGQMSALKDCLPLSKEALLLLPPEEASGYQVEESSWSSDGKYLIIRRRLMDYSVHEFEALFTTPGAEQPTSDQIAVYSAITGKTKVLTDIQDPNTIQGVDWIPGTSSAILEIHNELGGESHNSMLLLSVVGGPTGDLGLNTENIQGMGVVAELRLFWVSQQNKETGTTTVRFINDKGLLPGVVQVPATGGYVFHPGYGKYLYFKLPNREKTVAGGWKIDPQTGSVEKVDTLPKRVMRVEPPMPVSLTSSYVPVKDSKEPTSTTTVRLVAVGSDATVVVSSDGEHSELAPNATAVSYESRGALMVRRIVHVSLELYKQKLVAELRSKALDTAKQLGLALLMCANDYDDKFPSNGAGWRNTIDPYLKNQDMSAAFNYTYGGGPINAIASPATTQLGYVNGPDGQAVVFADGHAKYIPR